MDPTRFDALARAFSGLGDHLPSRRGLFQALGAGLLGMGAGTALENDGEAKKGRKKRRRKKKKPCLFGQRRCRDRRCHGCCSDADCGGNVCQVGVCSECPRNQRLCRDGCIPEDACCVDDECTGGRVCIDGTCGCGPERRLCEGVCIANDACCGTDCRVNTCSPENCNGCCDGVTCKDGDSLNFCGRGGAACAACSEGQICTGTRCLCPPECCVDADCDLAPDGLCRPDHVCAYPPTDCASAGEGCFFSPECCSQSCEVTTNTCNPGGAGRPCRTDADCTGGTTCIFYVCQA